uniref:NADH-ubiquinone oxidoreductase chain 3 n=1 Tax=Duplodicodrilus schmardae TaxID=320986 RepID=A0A142AG22_9ANNE|nr:NADH dehydrogenase subunit 3 [Duplodicodrilus schmardae]AMO27033.1 NADH dehydrogenase subunit 3 [Duplodicodrilus schmardae]BDQ43692.1 NADH dehydrogenase subunit 3 [Duplodicodrilus schmardae]BDQ43848.1 NADH dehydrogenase subunit 3 [Duplodicodrilus schmardae]
MVQATSMFTICAAIPMILLLVASLLAARSTEDREKSTPFECGFDPKSTARIPFSTRFFLLAIIFIVFDIEIVLLMPIPTMLMTSYTTHIMITYMLFIIVLIAGLIHEWNEGSLDWSM